MQIKISTLKEQIKTPFKDLIVVYQLYYFDMAFICRQEIRQDYAEDFVKLLFQ